MDSTLSPSKRIARRGWITLFVDGCWVIIKWVFVIGLICVVAGGYFYYHRLGENIRATFEEKLVQQYPDLEIKVGSARLREGGGIIVRDISLRDPQLPPPWDALLTIDEVILDCVTEIPDLLRGELDIQKLTLVRPVIYQTGMADGTQSTAPLFTFQESCDSHAPIQIVEGVVQLRSGEGSPTWMLREIELVFEPVSLQPEAQRGEPLLPAEGAALTAMQLQGTMSSDHFQKMNIEGRINPSSKGFEIHGDIETLLLSKEFLAILPDERVQGIENLESLSGKAQIAFSLSQEASQAEPSLQIDISGHLTEGAIVCSDWGYPLDDVEAFFQCTNAGLTVNSLTARSGPTRLQLAIGSDMKRPARWSVEGEVQALALDSRLAVSLPECCACMWPLFQPEGFINAEFRITGVGESMDPEVLVDCQGISFMYRDFPYRLEGTTGTLHFANETLDIDLNADAGSQSVAIEGRVHTPPDWAYGRVDFKTAGPVPIDDHLIEALDPKGQKIIRSFAARGMLTATGRLERAAEPGSPFQQHVFLGIDQCSIRYDQFPYPIENIQGSIEIRDGSWRFRDFRGHNDSATITCQGDWMPQAGGEALLTMDIVATDVPLEDELRDALSEEIQKAWLDLQPRGSLDHLDIDLSYSTANKKLELDVRGQKWPNLPGNEGRSIAIEPLFFPYALNDLTGTFHLHDDLIDFEEIHATHGHVRMAMAGRWEPLEEGGWRFGLTPFSVDRIVFNRDVLDALPSQWSAAMAKIGLSKPINVAGNIEFVQGGDPTSPLNASWDIGFDVEDGSIECKLPIEHVYGHITLSGQQLNNKLYCQGELDIDSAMIHDIQLTEIQGPLWIDNEKILLGTWANVPDEGTVPRQVVARTMGGGATLDAQYRFAEEEFVIRTSMSAGDLPTILRDLEATSGDISGKAFASLDLQGSGLGLYTLRGSGIIRLREADIYDLPLALALLRIITPNPLNDTAFTTSDIDFHIEGDHIYLDRIDLGGDALTLKGKGEMNFDREVNLNFYSIVGRDGFAIPFIRPLLSETSRQFLEIQVTGTLDEPEVQHEILPSVTETLQQLFPEEIRNLGEGVLPTEPANVFGEGNPFPRR